MAKLWAISDIHVGHKGNRPVTEDIFPPESPPDDWLILAGDVAEKTDDIRWALKLMRSRFAKVIWIPGNHELWTTAKDPVQMRGVARYDYLVTMCRELDVVTPRGPVPGVGGRGGGPVVLVPMFLLYDYSFLPEGTTTKADGWRSRGNATSSRPTNSCSAPTPISPATHGAAPASS